MNKPLLAGISKLQRESDYYSCTVIPTHVTENEHQSSFEDCIETIQEALYIYYLVRAAVESNCRRAETVVKCLKKRQTHLVDCIRVNGSPYLSLPSLLVQMPPLPFPQCLFLPLLCSKPGVLWLDAWQYRIEFWCKVVFSGAQKCTFLCQ